MTGIQSLNLLLLRFRASQIDFVALPECASKTTSKKYRKNCGKHGFWPPKTVPKSIQNAYKIDVSKNMRIFIDFCCFLVACCKSRTSNFMRPRNVLLAFHRTHVFAFGMRFRSKKLTKNPSKTRSESFQNRCLKRVVFQHRFFRVSASILEGLGPPSWNQVCHFGLFAFA